MTSGCTPEPSSGVEIDPDDIHIAMSAPPGLKPFNEAGVLTSADIAIARRLCALGDGMDPDVMLGVALAVRAPRLSHVCVDLATIAATVTLDLEELPDGSDGSRLGPVERPMAARDLAELAWPEPQAWIKSLRACPLVAADSDPGGVGAPPAPMRLEGARLYLDRYWRAERFIAADLRGRAERGGHLAVSGVDTQVLSEGLSRLFPHVGEDRGQGPDLQRVAAAAAVLNRFSVIAGGPGTGKTTTVARLLALLDEQALASGEEMPRVALAAPTGKAAARLEEAVQGEANRIDVAEVIRERLVRQDARTLHRLLGWRPGSHTRFRHNRDNRLPFDVVVVDETSMVSLSLMARLLEAVGPEARLVLLGDPDQLASVEAGAVLGDILGPVAGGLRMGAGARDALASVVGVPVAAEDPPGNAGVGDGMVVLRQVHRYGGQIAALASAVQRGDVHGAIDVLGSGSPEVDWIEADVAAPGTHEQLAPVRELLVGAGAEVFEAARTGDAWGALGSLGAARLLCAHRRGPYGVRQWGSQVERWLGAAVHGYGEGGTWYPGRPLLVTANDYSLGLYNGDTGVVISTAAATGSTRARPGAGARGDSKTGMHSPAGAGVHDGVVSSRPLTAAVFERRGELIQMSPTRLDSVEDVHAMTVHKSQGSQFEAVVVVLPQEPSPLLTREMLYTAFTRARRRLIVVATAESIRAAIARPVARASGLADRIWA